MDIVEFFELSAGKWSSMRTSHHAAAQQGGGKSTIEIDLLDKSDPDVIRLCQTYKVDPETALFGARLTWDGFLDHETKAQKGSTVLVSIAQSPTSGQIIGEAGTTQKTPLVGRYEVSDQLGLTLITESDTMYSKERIWFESPNVRFRHSILKQSGGFSMTSFCSEVRMGGVKPDPALP
jgi:hypothetical protein